MGIILISYKNEFIFVHNYKVAGTSINNALKNKAIINNFIDSKKAKLLERISPSFVLGNYFLKTLKKFIKDDSQIFFKHHDKAVKIKNELSNHIYNDFFKFGFVRNPWDWQVSLYHFMQQNKNHFQHDLISGMSFEEYIKWKVDDNFILQKEFFYDENNDLIVDYVGKLEKINKEFNYICSQVDIKARLPHKNKSEHKEYQKYYNDKTRELVEDCFIEDIKEFDYEF